MIFKFIVAAVIIPITKLGLSLFYKKNCVRIRALKVAAASSYFTRALFFLRGWWTMQSVSLAIWTLVKDPNQPRKSLNSQELEPLVVSIKNRGVLLPIRVKPPNSEGFHVLVSGHRRLAALQELGETHAPCVIVKDGMEDSAVLAEQLAENVHRENLNPVDEAEAFRRYISCRGITASQAAEELQVLPARMSRSLAILKLPEEIQSAVRTQKISKEAAYYLSRLPEGDDRSALFTEALAGAQTRDRVAHAVNSILRNPSTPSVGRVACKLSGNRTVTVSGQGIHLDDFIGILAEVLKEARKARVQGWDVATLAKVFRDRAELRGVQ